jgi:hypothetical protein
MIQWGYMGKNDQKCKIYSISSQDAKWSRLRDFSDKMWRADTGGFWFNRSRNKAVVCRSMVHWLFPYQHGDLAKYYIFNVSAETNDTSLTEITGPLNNFAYGNHKIFPMLNVTVDGSLSILCLHIEPCMWWIDTWMTMGDNNIDGGVVWVRTKVVRLNVPRQRELGWLSHARVWPGAKSGTFFIMHNTRFLRRVDIQREKIEMKCFSSSLCSGNEPVEIEWPVLFASLLG